MGTLKTLYHFGVGARATRHYGPDRRREKSENNGIWLCAACADLVDKNGGDDYPTELLQRWKAAREAASASDVGRPAASVSIIDGRFEAHGVSNVTGLDVQRPARLQPGTHAIATGITGVTGARFGGGSPTGARDSTTPAHLGRVAASFGVCVRHAGFEQAQTGMGVESRVVPIAERPWLLIVTRCLPSATCRVRVVGVRHLP